jgi:hypothetical protein
MCMPTPAHRVGLGEGLVRSDRVFVLPFRPPAPRALCRRRSSLPAIATAIRCRRRRRSPPTGKMSSGLYGRIILLQRRQHALLPGFASEEAVGLHEARVPGRPVSSGKRPPEMPQTPPEILPVTLARLSSARRAVLTTRDDGVWRPSWPRHCGHADVGRPNFDAGDLRPIGLSASTKPFLRRPRVVDHISPAFG